MNNKQGGFIPQSNVNVANAILKLASPDYQRRVPVATQANITETIRNIMSDPFTRNEFIPAMFNRIGLEIFKSPDFSNPFAKYKRPVMEYGDVIEEVQLGLVQAYTLDQYRETMEKMLFGRHETEAQSSFHRINREDVYPITVNHTLLKRAFTAEYGLSTFINEQMKSLHKSDEWDEWLIMANLFTEYDKSDGFFKEQVPNLASPNADGDDARALLKKLRWYGDSLPYISRKYNAAGMPVSASPDQLTLFVTASANATMDVDGLAAAYNMDRANYYFKREVIPDEHMAIPGAQAILTTEDFFVCLDTVNQVREQPNAASLDDNMFLHRHGVYSTSRFVPAILFTTEAGSEVIELTATPEAITPIVLTDSEEEVTTEFTRGAFHTVSARTQTDNNNGINEGVTYEIVGAQSSYTVVNQHGTVRVGFDELASELSVVVSSVADPTIRSSRVIPVVGDILHLWPNPEVIDGDDEQVTPVVPTQSGSTVTIPTVTGVKYYDLDDDAEVTDTVTAPVTVYVKPEDGYYITRDNGVIWSYA